MHVALDQQTCQQTGFCVRVVPEVFALVAGRIVVLQPDADPQLDEALDEAERLCPTGAIVLEI